MKSGKRCIMETDIFGTKSCSLDGQYHRINGPAVEWNDGSSFWYKRGKLHRLDGPAIHYTATGFKEYWIEAKKYSAEEFSKLTGIEVPPEYTNYLKLPPVQINISNAYGCSGAPAPSGSNAYGWTGVSVQDIPKRYYTLDQYSYTTGTYIQNTAAQANLNINNCTSYSSSSISNTISAQNYVTWDGNKWYVSK